MHAAQLRALGYVVPSPNKAAAPQQPARPANRKWGDE